MVTAEPVRERRPLKTPRILALVLLAGAVALMLLPFHLLAGQFQDQHQFFSTEFGREGPQEIAQNQEVDLYVIGANWFTRGMVGPLARELEKNPYIGAVRLREGSPQISAGPVLVIRMDQAGLFWTAVYGRADLKVHISYATDGAVDWMDDEVIQGQPGPFTKYMTGDFETTSSAFGIMSLPGYSAYLGQHLGEKISAAIEGTLKD